LHHDPAAPEPDTASETDIPLGAEVDVASDKIASIERGQRK
jgi:hypothetical protein